MFAGHFFLAFLIVTVLGLWRSLDRDHVLVLGLFAGGFAVLPDLDIVYAFKVFASFSFGSGFLESFWGTSTVIHRGISHSVVTGLMAASLFALGYERESYVGNVLSVLFLGVFAFLVSGWIGAGVLILYGVAGGLLSIFAENFVSRMELFAVALTGLVSHPFGDVFTGSPPDFFYPLGFELIGSRVALFADQTVNLVSLTILELGIVLAGVWMFSYLKSETVSLRDFFPLLGVFYGLAAFIIPAPSIAESYLFVLTVLGMGVVVAVLKESVRFDKDVLKFFSVALSTSIIGCLSFLLFYLI